MAAEKGANEVALAVLAITLVAVVVFFPVTFLFGVSKYLFTALALGVVIALFASYFVAVTVVPLFCARYLKAIGGHKDGETAEGSSGERDFTPGSTRNSTSHAELLRAMGAKSARPSLSKFSRLRRPLSLEFPALSVRRCVVFSAHRCGPIHHQSQGAYGHAHRDHEDYVKKVEDIVRQVVPPERLEYGRFQYRGDARSFFALFTPNSGMHTAFVQVGLKEDHKVSSFAYMDRGRENASRSELPELRTYFQSGGLVDAVLESGSAGAN